MRKPTDYGEIIIDALAEQLAVAMSLYKNYFRMSEKRFKYATIMDLLRQTRCWLIRL